MPRKVPIALRAAAKINIGSVMPNTEEHFDISNLPVTIFP